MKQIAAPTVIKKLTMYERLAYSVPDKASEIVYSYGYKNNIRNANELSQLISYLWNKNEDSREKFVEIHPDRELIIENYKRSIKPMSADAEDDTPTLPTPANTDNNSKIVLTDRTAGILIGAGIILGVIVLVKFMA